MKIILRKLVAHNISIDTSPLISGIPTISTFGSFVDALKRELNKMDDYKTLEFSQFSIIIHDFKPYIYNINNNFYRTAPKYRVASSEGYVFDNNTREKSNLKIIRQASLLPYSFGTITFSLILNTEINDSSIYNIEQDIFDILIKLKFAKGTLYLYDRDYSSTVISEKQAKFTKQDILRKLMPGYCLVCRNDLLENKEPNDLINDFIAYLGYYVIKLNKNQVICIPAKKDKKGWLIPIGVGFQFLTEIPKSSIHRDENKKMFLVETIHTLGELKNLVSIDNIEDVFWNYEVTNNYCYYYTKNNFEIEE
jgi:CRISPR type I-F-associated protein Csy2